MAFIYLRRIEDNEVMEKVEVLDQKYDPTHVGKIADGLARGVDLSVYRVDTSEIIPERRRKPRRGVNEGRGWDALEPSTSVDA